MPSMTKNHNTLWNPEVLGANKVLCSAYNLGFSQSSHYECGYYVYAIQNYKIAECTARKKFEWWKISCFVK